MFMVLTLDKVDESATEAANTETDTQILVDAAGTRLSH
jgi:hypothetical protein